jgi:hypothetical protein
MNCIAAVSAPHVDFSFVINVSERGIPILVVCDNLMDIQGAAGFSPTCTK